MTPGDWSIAWPAPAKLNLMLRVLGRREDGYHELQTVFQFLDCNDWLDFRVRPDRDIKRLSDVPGVAPEQDLVVRAARLLQSHAGVSLGADIRIHKRLPMGGGLGGGSSDAASTLVGLNRLWDCHLSHQELAQLGLALGADIPVFVHGQAAWAEGVGERFESIDLPEDWFLVLVPSCHVSTAEVFAAPHLTRDSARITIRAFTAGETGNDCLPVVRESYPLVAQALDWLEQFAQPRLTGTGACVFAQFQSRARAEQVLAMLPPDLVGFVARGINQSPLIARLAEERANG